MGKSGPLYFMMACLFPCIPIMLLRGEAREAYGIEGDTGTDAVTSLCCGACAMCQVAVEVKKQTGQE